MEVAINLQKSFGIKTPPGGPWTICDNSKRGAWLSIIFSLRASCILVLEQLQLQAVPCGLVGEGEEREEGSEREGGRGWEGTPEGEAHFEREVAEINLGKHSN